MRHVIAVLAAGIAVGGFLVAGVAVTWARWMRTRSDLAKARSQVKGLRSAFWSGLGELVKGVATIAAVLVVLGILAWIGGQR